MAGSSAEETLEAGIRAARKLSMDGTRAIYDLTSGVDFSKPRRTAEAIARVVWEQDVESWWTWEGTEPVFKPNRTVEIRLPPDPIGRSRGRPRNFRRTSRRSSLPPLIRTWTA